MKIIIFESFKTLRKKKIMYIYIFYLIAFLFTRTKIISIFNYLSPVKKGENPSDYWAQVKGGGVKIPL